MHLMHHSTTQRFRLFATAFTAIAISLTFTELAEAKPSKNTSKQAPAAPQAAPAATGTPVPMPGTDKTLFDGSFNELPTNITADNLTLHQDNRVFIYKGNVVVTQGDMTLTSKTLEGTYSEQNEIQRLVAKGDVVITKQDMHATSQQALYDAATATVTLIETPQVQQKESILTADKIKIFLNENRSQAEGAVRVTIVKPKDTPKKDPAKDAAAKPEAAKETVATPTPAVTAIEKQE